MGNPFLNDAFGLRLIENPSLVIGPFEDWSQVRSHGRAARRRRQGHPQRIRLYYKPDPSFLRVGDTIIAHPVTMAQIREQVRILEQGKRPAKTRYESNPHRPHPLFRNDPGS